MSERLTQAEPETVPTGTVHDWKLSFFTIWTGQAFSLVGSRITQFALVWWLTELTESATVLATATIVALIPEILLGPVAGAYVDRLNRRMVMMVADGLIALASLWLAGLFWIGQAQIWHIYVIMALRAVGGSFHWPAMQASTSLMVPKQHLTRVAGLNQTMYGFLNIIGPPLGALLMELLPLYGVMLVDVGTALLAIVPLFFVHIPQPRRKTVQADGSHKTSVWTDIVAGLRYLWGWPGMVAVIGVAMIFKIAATPAFSLLPLLVREYFHGDAAQFSLLEALSGVGMILGGLVLSVWGGFPRKIFTTITGLIALGASFLLLGFTPSTLFPMALVSGFAMGFVIPMIDGPFMAILQSVIAPELQGRIFMLVGSLLSITSPMSLIVAGPVSDWLGLRVWYLAAGALCIVIGTLGFFVPVITNVEENARGGA